MSSPARHNEFFGRDTSKHSQRASRIKFSTSVYEQFEPEPGSWWIQQRGALRCPRVFATARPASNLWSAN